MSLICVLPHSRAAHLNEEIMWLSASAVFGTPVSWLVGCRFLYQRLRRLFDCFRGKGKGKGKAVPLQAWTGPEGSRRLRLPDFKTIRT